MKKTIFTILLAIISIGMLAQQRLSVRDSLTQEPIAYTSVWFGNNAGGYTDESGMIEIPEETEQIRLSHICYETKNISEVTANSQTIFLVPKNYSTHYLVFTEIKKPIYATLRFDLRLPEAKTGAPKA